MEVRCTPFSEISSAVSKEAVNWDSLFLPPPSTDQEWQWQVYKYITSYKRTQISLSLVGSTGTGARGKGHLVCRGGRPKLYSTLPKEARYTMEVLKSAIFPLCSVYYVDFRDLGKQNYDVAGGNISSSVDFVLPDPLYNVGRSWRGSNHAPDIFPEAYVVYIVTTCDDVMRGCEHAHIFRILQFCWLVGLLRPERERWGKTGTKVVCRSTYEVYPIYVCILYERYGTTLKSSWHW